MDKDIFFDLLSEYILGQISDETRMKVKTHLDSGCVRCSTEMHVLQETIHLLPLSLRGAAVSPKLKRKIDAVIEEDLASGAGHQSGSQRISHYRLLRKLGAGAMGEVYLAEDTNLGRTAALKMIRPELASNQERKQRFFREARAAARLNHPGIATIYEVGEEEGTNFIAMEYVEGRSLAELIRQGPMPPHQVINTGMQIAEALAEAHLRGIIHRDLKPENIQIGSGGQAKILDFGLAKFNETRLEDDYTTSSDRILGTIPYLSPEQISGGTLDSRSDLFSLGSILYEMCAGKSPFLGGNPAGTIENILEAAPPPFSAPEALQQVILKCLKKNPDQRYPSTKELEEDLRRLQKGEEPGTFPQTKGISIAVLYFENLSEEKESDYFRAGMTEDIIVELSKVKSWDVRPRAQVVKYKDQQIDLREAGAQLKVTHILNGTIRKAGNRLRISAQLVDARNAISLWAERYDRKLQDVFDIQDEIARKIADALQVHLSSSERKEISKRYTDNLQAYDCYLRGREMIFRLSREDVAASIDYFRKAIGTDPNYALAHAGLAQAYGIQLSFYGGDSSLADQAITEAGRALDLDNALGQSYAALGLAYFLKGMSSEAMQACERAMQLNANDAFAAWIYGRLTYRLNLYEEAARHFQRTIELLPDFYTAYSDLAQTYENMGTNELAQETQQRTVETCRHYLKNFPNEARAHILLATHSARLGNRDEAISEGLLAVGLSPDDPVMMYNMACLYSLLNELEAAMQWLSKSIQHGRRDFEWMKRDPALKNIRNHPDFQKMCGETE